jgi:hypothetical protein
MTTDVTKLPGNYIIEAKQGHVLINVSDSAVTVPARVGLTGTVIINGNLDVIGQTTQLATMNTVISGTVITLNQGEIGTNSGTTDGISTNGGKSGLKIARGYADADTYAAFLLYDDTVANSYPTGTVRGIWKFGNLARLGYAVGAAIEVPVIKSPLPNLNLLGSGTNTYGVVHVTGTVNYEQQVDAYGDDAIPNKKYVDNKLSAGTTSTNKIQVGNSFVKINSADVSHFNPYYNDTDKIFATLSTDTNIVFRLEGSVADIQGFNFNKSAGSITLDNTNTNLVLNPGGLQNSTGTLIINSALRLVYTPPVSNKSGYTSIYTTSTVGGGGTGVFYVNNTNRDELVSRRRSIIYGIIF